MPEQIAWTLNPTDTRTFTGTAHSRLIAAADSEFPVKLFFVRFQPGARTYWHAHAGIQILVVTSGRCRYQRDGGPVLEAEAGESLRFAPGERHWHGATPSEAAEHIAINLDSRETDWMEPVEEADYGEEVNS